MGIGGNDSVTYKFRIDLSQMTVEGQKAVALLEKLERGGDKASRSMDKLKGSADKTKDSLAANAVNFQTATQGMLNLSTAAVQTYTSISNLARANNRAKMSVIAVARAEDLLANKIERQNALREAGAAGSQKYINITKEIATAQADLTVKQEKMVIEQEAVNDIYMLFATNVANVTISSMQTIAVLDKNSIILNKAKAIGMKLNNFLSINAARTAYSEAAAQAVNSTAKGVAIGVTAKLTAAMYGLAAASKAVVMSNPILMAAMAAMTVAWAVHETDILGTKTALDGYLGVEKDHLAIMEEERRATDALTAANNNLSDSYVKLRPEVKQTYEMLRDAAVHMGDARLAAQYSAQLLGKRPQDFSSPSAGGGFSGTSGGGFSGTSGGVSVGQQTAATTATGAQRAGRRNAGRRNAGRRNAGSILPQAHAEEPTVSTPNPPVDNTLADPFGTPLQQELYKNLNPIEQRDTNIVLAAREQNAGRSGASKAYLDEAKKLLNAAKNYVEPPTMEEWWKEHLKDVDLDETSFFGMTVAKKKGFAGTGGAFDFDLPPREMIKKGLGIDIGNIANVANITDAIKLARLQYEGKSMRGRGGRAEYALAELTKQGQSFRNMAQLNDVSAMTGGLIGGKTNFGKGFFKSTGATAAYQIQEFDHLRKKRRRELDIKDANVNRLRWGGKLRDGFSIWDEGAVVGGYGSAKAFSQAGKRRQSEAWEEAQRFMFGFGFTGIKRYTGLSDLRGKLNSIARQANERRTALTSAGLSYKSFNINGSRYRHGRAAHAAFERERQAILAFNNNQFAKANVINLLEQDYEVRGFKGTTMSLPSLQDEVAKQDALMESIGLNRTEAFQIIDTEGRGREEIDDRILWKDRVNNMSTGTSVL